MMALASSKCRLRPLDDDAAGLAEHRIGQDRDRIGADDPGVAQRLARQVEPAHRGILVEIAQDVGELQRAAEMIGERQTGLLPHAEDPHRQPPDRAGHAVAIERERRAIRRADIGDHIHFHAVDDGEEILVLEIEGRHRRGETAQVRRRRAAIERVEVRAPLLQLPAPRLARPGIVGDVVDGAAERVDLEHRLALGARQNPHPAVERTARGARGGR